MTLPRVVALMATQNRVEFAHRATHYFLNQDYPGEKKLLVFDDGDDYFVPCDGARHEVEVVYHEKTSLPAKRNQMVRYVADTAAIYIIWDDDDYHGPSRIANQVDWLIKNPNSTACLFKPFLYYNKIRRVIKRGITQTPDASLAFRYSFWQERNWDETIDPGSGYRMISRRDPHTTLHVDSGLDYIAVWHGSHRFAAPPEMQSPAWSESPITSKDAELLLRVPIC